MLNDKDYLEATRRFKNKKENAHARQRYHALLLVTKGYSYRETADILFVDEETLSRWTELYQERGLDGLKNHPQWGGEHGQRLLTIEELARLSTLLEGEAMPGTEVCSGWTLKAIRDLIAERFEVSYCRRAVRKLLRAIKWSYQRGRKLYVKRSAEEQARFELETQEVLAELAESGVLMTPLAGDQSKVYLEGTIAKRWNPIGQQPLVLSYRGQYQIEQSISRLKGRRLGLQPIYLQKEERITGLIHLLTLCLRELTLLEFVVRRELANQGEQLKGIYSSQRGRQTGSPSAELILEAFRGISVTTVEVEGKQKRLLNELNEVQQRLLALLNLPKSIYEFLSSDFINPVPL